MTIHTTLDDVFMFAPDLLPSHFYSAGTAADRTLIVEIVKTHQSIGVYHG